MHSGFLPEPTLLPSPCACSLPRSESSYGESPHLTQTRDAICSHDGGGVFNICTTHYLENEAGHISSICHLAHDTGDVRSTCYLAHDVGG